MDNENNYLTNTSFDKLLESHKSLGRLEEHNKILSERLEKYEQDANIIIKPPALSSLSQKQIVLLFYYLDKMKVINVSALGIDATKQVDLISLLSGVKRNNKYKNWNLYRYWNDLLSVSKFNNIATKENLNKVFNHAKEINYKSLMTEIQKDINKL